MIIFWVHEVKSNILLKWIPSVSVCFFFFLVWLLEYWKLHIYGWNFISFEQNYSRENFHEALGAEW